jgi:carboxypeptidase family protein
VQRIGRTGPDGRFSIPDQPAGTWQIAANYRRTMSRSGGVELDGRGIVRAAAGDVVDGLELRLPIRAADVVSAAGQVVDGQGLPLPGVSVFANYQEGVRTDAQGRFRLDSVLRGQVVLTLRLKGYERLSESRGIDQATTDLRFVLKRAEPGTLSIGGSVFDETGALVAGARVFLGDGTREGARWARTDAKGAFQFDGLPERYSVEPVAISVPGSTTRAGWATALLEGVTAPSANLRLRVRRTCMLSVFVRCAETGDPMQHVYVEFSHEVHADGLIHMQRFRSHRKRDEHGRLDVPVPRGRIVLHVEAPGRAPVDAEITIDNADSPKEVVVKMLRDATPMDE